MEVKSSSHKLRVANIIEEGRWGGPQKRITMVASALKKQGIETVVILPSQESDRFQHELKIREISHRVIQMHRLGRKLFTLCLYALNFFKDVFVLVRELKSGGFDLVHVSGGAWQLKGAIAGKFAGIPVLWHLNDTQMPVLIVSVFRFLAHYLAGGFIVTADRVRRYYIEGTPLVAKPVFPVQAPVDTVVYDIQKVTKDAGIEQYPGVKIVSVANISPIKGLETLIAAATLLKEMIEDYSVIIVGPVYETQKEYFKKLQDRVKYQGLENCLFFIGRHENIPAVMHSADIFVCSSIAESGPMTVWEAMSMNRAIVSTDVGDVACYIRSGENGYVVPVGDDVSMAKSISRLANNSQLRKEFGLRARQVAVSRLDINSVADSTAMAYLSIVGM